MEELRQIRRGQLGEEIPGDLIFRRLAEDAEMEPASDATLGVSPRRWGLIWVRRTSSFAGIYQVVRMRLLWRRCLGLTWYSIAGVIAISVVLERIVVVSPVEA
ncbi:hypothetical protein MLD38_036268 [Melastoma candidum]|uniref:Uncharacterized protein n=2 Tax=Melastoma candidum TaxID=119954 RepID=A0ACB9LK38_9MYRT|nr:hypothetical protein MLD38_036267 [Melastoma candidum]KAI4311364.1 hypothetical protein MLD38_036268 [Melastoma candidum]